MPVQMIDQIGGGLRAVLAFPWFLIGLGVIYRLAQYLHNRALWVDEISLSLNIMQRDYAALLQPLDLQQGAPVGFLWLQRLAVDLFGTGEHALRLVPLLASIGAMILIYYVGRAILSPIGTLIALGLFALIPDLIYSASEVKQYSSDALITLVLLGLALSMRTAPITLARAGLFALAGAALLWASHTAIFMLAGVGLVLFIDRLRAGARRDSLLLGIVGAVWLASFAAFYLINLRYLNSNSYLLEFWQDGFMPLIPRSLDDIRWFDRQFFGIFGNPMGYTMVGVAAFAFVVGCLSLGNRDRVRLALLLAPIGVSLVASALGQYPFKDRMILFVTPILTLLMAEGADRLQSTLAQAPVTPRWLPRTMAILFILVLFFEPVSRMITIMLRPHYTEVLAIYGGEETRPVMAYLADQRQPDDVIYAYYGFGGALQYYGPRYGLAESDYILGDGHRLDWGGYYAEIDALPRHDRVWLLFTHVHPFNGGDERVVILDYLRRMGAVQHDRVASPGAWGYLFDLSEARRLES